MWSSIFLLSMVAVPLMGSPGPATLSLAALGSTYGMRPVFPYYIGIVAGTISVLLLVAAGFSSLVYAYPRIATVVGVVAAIYILYLAYKIATAPTGKARESKTTVPSIGAGFLLALGNPKAFAAIGAVYSSTRISGTEPVLEIAVKLAVLALVIVAVNYTWLVLGSVMSAYFHSHRSGRVLNIVFSLLLLVSVLLAFVGLFQSQATVS